MRDGTTVLLTTQYLEEADRLADRVAFLGGGRIVASGTPAELKSALRSEVARVELADGRVVEHEVDGSAAAVQRLLAELGPAALRIELVRPSLDDVFRAVAA